MAYSLKFVFDKAIEELEKVGIQYDNTAVKLESFESTTRWGVCQFHSQNGFSIKINKVLLQTENLFYATNTMIHEILHVIAFKAKCHTHSGVWKQLANKVSCYSDYKISRVSAYPKSVIQNMFSQARYVVGCANCEDIRYARTYMSDLIKHPEQYICRKCRNNLKRIK